MSMKIMLFMLHLMLLLNFQQIFGNSFIRKPTGARSDDVPISSESYQNIRSWSQILVPSYPGHLLKSILKKLATKKIM